MRAAALSCTLSIFLSVFGSVAYAAQNRDAVACDSLDPATRIEGCGRLISSGRLPKKLLWVGYYQRGQGYAMLSRFDEAIADFNKSIAATPTSTVYSNRGSAYRAKRDFVQAHRDLDKAIELDPKNNEAYHNKGFTYGLQNDQDNAIKFYDKALAIKKVAVTYNGRGLAWRGKKTSTALWPISMRQSSSTRSLQIPTLISEVSTATVANSIVVLRIATRRFACCQIRKGR